MANLKIWSGLKIPQKLFTKLSKYGSQIRHQSTRENAMEWFLARRLEAEIVCAKASAKQYDFMPETILPLSHTPSMVEPKRVQLDHQQTQADPFNSAGTDSDLDFLHQIGMNRFPALDKGRWWGLYEGTKSAELSQFSQMKLLLAMFCVWSAEQAQILCSAASKMYQRSIEQDETDDVCFTPKSDIQTCSRNNMTELIRAQEKQAAAFRAKLEKSCPANVFNEKALKDTLSFNDVFAFQPPYPRLQPNTSKFTEGLLNSPIHFTAVKRAFSTSHVAEQNVPNAGVSVPDQTIQSQNSSPTRKQFLKSCSDSSSNTLNRESYTRETINKMTNVIKRLPSIADLKKAEQKQKQRAEAKHDEKFEKNVYFLGNKCLNGILKDESTTVLTDVVHTLQQDVNKLSQDKAVLSTDVKGLSEQVEALAQRETSLKNEIEVLNDQFHTISSENREMFKVKEATFNLVEELCLRRDALAKEEEVLWQKLERLNKRIAEKYKRVNPYGEYNDDLFSMETMLCSESGDHVESKLKAGQFLHKKVCPAMQTPDDSLQPALGDAGNVAETYESESARAQVKAMIMEANKHRFRRCEVPISKERRCNTRKCDRRDKLSKKA